MPTLRRDFESRDDLIAHYREQFPEAAAVSDWVSDTRGGRDAAEALLDNVDPVEYGRTRNHLSGAVTRLSPYLRHGVLGLAETRDAALAKVDDPSRAYKLVNELAWRDYYRRVLAEIGDAVWDDREPYKTGLDAEDYADDMPDDVTNAETGNDFVDGSVRELYETGYLHNQQRMKLAAYVVHWRRVRWQAGAAWFLSHLLDGDVASNNLSWQWVASTFSHQPYIFNQENLRQWMGGRFTGDSVGGGSPFRGEYDEIKARIFPRA